MLFVLFVYNLLGVAFRLYYSYGYYSYKGAYISDEGWYVSSSRNLLVKVFGIDNISTNDSSHSYYTLVFKEKPDPSTVRNILGTSCFVLVEDDYTGSVPKPATVFTDNTSTTVTLFLGNGLNAVYVKSINNNCGSDDLIRVFNGSSLKIVDVVPGWALPDRTGINYYLNLEHPPLAKYLFASTIFLLGDFPVWWRLPDIIASSIVFVLAYFIIVEVLKGLIGVFQARIIGLSVPLIMLFDNVYYTVGVLAMLDSFLALFTVLGIYVFIKYPYHGRLRYSVTRNIIFSLAGLVKFSGLFVTLADFAEGFFSGKNYLERLRSGFSALIRYYAFYPLLLLIFSSPLISYLGWENWFNASVLGAFRWHLRTKTLGGPIASSPIDWLLGYNSYIMWIDRSSGLPVYCKGLYFVYISSFILGLLVMPLYIGNNKIRRLSLSFYSIWFGYMLLYVLGNHSLYSFYIIHFSAISEVLLVALVVIVLLKLLPSKIKDRLIG